MSNSPKEELEKLDKLYSALEKEMPPSTFNAHEHEYNVGFYKGQLKALELVCVRVFGLPDGDALAEKKTSPPSKP